VTCNFCHRTRWGNLPSRAAKPFPCLQLTGRVYKVSSKASGQTCVIPTSLLFNFLLSFLFLAECQRTPPGILELTLYRGEALILTLHNVLLHFAKEGGKKIERIICSNTTRSQYLFVSIRFSLDLLLSRLLFRALIFLVSFGLCPAACVK
jgi:hypothetical protein